MLRKGEFPGRRRWREWREIIWAPADYWQAPDKAHFDICNGCGAAKAKLDFVPDTMYGLFTGAACDVHDWMYHFGETDMDRYVADTTFLNNCLRIVSHKGGFFAFARAHRALNYYLAVRKYGKGPFYEGKPDLQAET